MGIYAYPPSDFCLCRVSKISYVNLACIPPYPSMHPYPRYMLWTIPTHSLSKSNSFKNWKITQQLFILRIYRIEKHIVIFLYIWVIVLVFCQLQHSPCSRTLGSCGSVCRWTPATGVVVLQLGAGDSARNDSLMVVGCFFPVVHPPFFGIYSAGKMFIFLGGPSTNTSHLVWSWRESAASHVASVFWSSFWQCPEQTSHKLGICP